MNDLILREMIKKEGLTGIKAMEMFFALKIALKHKDKNGA